MNIKDLEYFVAIVESDFNLSVASKKLFVSQPALTKCIKEIEANQDVVLFFHSKGRLRDLTEAGTVLYDNAVIILNQYQSLIEQLQECSQSMKGTLRIGIPPVFVSILFTRLLVRLAKKYPAVQFEVVEVGATELRQKLLQQEIDFAILIEPVDLPKNRYEVIPLYRDELAILMSASNPLADKKTLQWTDILASPFVLLNQSYAIYQHILDKFASLDFHPNVVRYHSTWTSLVEFIQCSDAITILPRPLKNNLNSRKVACCSIVDPIGWNIALCFEKRKLNTNIGKLVSNNIIDYFSTKKSWSPSKG